jgi:hypothetical protein
MSGTRRDTCVHYRGLYHVKTCGTGKLHWRIAGYNGHVAARCDTDDCINFIE